MSDPTASLEADPSILRSSEHRRDRTILFITDRRFWNRSIGSEQRIASLVRYLARRGVPTTVAYLGRLRARERSVVRRFEDDCPGLEIVDRRATLRSAVVDTIERVRAAARLSWRRPHRRRSQDIAPHGPGPHRPSPARRTFVDRTIRERAPRVVVIELLRLAPLVEPGLRSRWPSNGSPPQYWIDLHDLLHERAERTRTADRRPVHEIGPDEELHVLSTFDALIAIQAREGERLRELLPDKPIHVVPHGIEIPESPRARVRRESPARPIRLGFLGGRDESNHAALDWFTEHVWPILLEETGDAAELVVAGQVCRDWRPPKIRGLHMIGPIASIDDFWPDIEIAINPVFFGSGLKIKNVEALAHGCALLTTSVGAQGLEEASPDGLRITDDAEQWLEILRTWLRDPDARESVATRGQWFARAHLSEQAAFDPLVRAFEDVP